MNTAKIIADLRAERDRIDDAIRALEALAGAGSLPRGAGSKLSTSTKRGRGGISPAGRKRISEMMKKRWAERRKAAARAAKNSA